MNVLKNQNRTIIGKSWLALYYIIRYLAIFIDWLLKQNDKVTETFR